MGKYPLNLKIRLDWSEMDLFGHINNVQYFKFIQASRIHYWEAVGLDQLFKDTRVGVILAKTGCQFLKPLHFPGTITVQVKLDFIKTTSFGLSHQILNEQGEVAAEAQDVLVMYDFNRNEKVLIPESIRQQFEKIEGRSLS